MAKRINRQIKQRYEMLCGISQELRTPITRLKLQLAMIDQKNISEKMSRDIDEMENMLNDYLQFAKTQAKEETTNVKLQFLFEEIKKDLNNKNLFLQNLDNVELNGRLSSLRRCFENVIQNGLTYGKNVYVELQKGNNRAIINIDDDGPGISEDQHRNVFKPFFRLDKSRNLNKAGVGLGLAIVEDIVNAHGGNIQLNKSKYNGLQVKISLPF